MAEPRTALITGASAGIGAALAGVFAEHGFDLVLVARRRERLEELATRVEREHGVKARVLVEDLSDSAAPERLYRSMEQQAVAIDALVNNAGFAVSGKFRDAGWKRQAECLNVLITSLVHLTHLFEPAMTERGYGRILNVASVAGLIPGTPKSTLYGPAKAFVIKFSEALALEHRGDGVHVTALCPGYTLTEFHDVLGTRERMNRLPRWMWLDADTVAREGYEAVMQGRPVVIDGALYKGIATLAKYLPDRAVRSLLAAYAQRTRRS